ncbi:MAG: hypothetical protein PF517_00865 [Salinivirgaceae bacterium]|jgi:hypothetical protein|nr:hypothetical protein [Salinivirgaceae bacterium]
MTEQEIVSMGNAIENAGLAFTKFPKKLEIKFPKAKYPGMYLSIPTDVKSFKLQVYCHQASFGFMDKLNLRGYKLETGGLHQSFAIKEVKGIPTEEEVAEYLIQGLETAITIGIVRAPELAN